MSNLPATLLVLQDGQQTGPFPIETVTEMLRLGTFAPGDLAWGEGLADWLPLSTLFPGPAAPAATGPKYTRAEALIMERALASAARAADAEDLTFAEYVRGAFSYPFKGDGPLILASGTVFFTILGTVMKYAVRIGFISFSVFFAMAFLMGYFAAMVMSIVQSTANGDRGLPSWPDADGWGGHFWKSLVLLLLCLGPGYAVLLFGTASQDGQMIAAGLAALALGMAYLPMALLTVSLCDSVMGINPMVVFPWIFATFSQYIVVVLMSIVAQGIPTALDLLIRTEFKDLGLGIRVALTFFSTFGSLWSWFVIARMLGGLHRVNRDKLIV